MSEKRYTVGGEERMLKEYLLSELGISVRQLKALKMGGLFVNGERVTVRKVLKSGDEVTLKYEDTKSEIAPIAMPLDIVFEDDFLLAVNKSVHMPVHPSLGNSLPTLAAGVMHYYRDRDFVFRAVNRLDRETSGIVLIAKSREAAYHLSEAMKRGEFIKEYLAVVEGVVTPREGRIDAPIARESEGAMRRVVSERGKEAVTLYETLETAKDTSLLRVRPITGRTHQIRVHMAHVGHPLKYDFLYGERTEGKEYMLHAERLSFPHPETGERITLVAECPFLKAWRD